MADYAGYISDPVASIAPWDHWQVGDIGQGRSRLVYNYDESGSGSYPSGDYPSGVTALGIPIMGISPGGYSVMFLAIEPGKEVKAMVWPADEGKLRVAILDRAGRPIAAGWSTDHEQWQDVRVQLPSGYGKGIYLLEIANYARQTHDDTRAFVGSIEVV